MQELITVLTPVYNRRKEILKLFSSLNKQTTKEFVWMIVNDGSTDDLESVIEHFKEEAVFKIEYYYKENGGKHTALNFGFKKINTELTFIVDSDDVLVEDAIETIMQEWENVKEHDLAGISFLRGYSNNKVIGSNFPTNGVYNGIDIQFRYKVLGDKAEVWRTDLLQQYEFPVFENEKFQGENYIWWQIALKYDMMYINKIIYITEYLEGGLTKSGKKLRIRCPLGGMENSKIGFDKKFPLRERMKRAWLFICYGKFAGKTFLDIVRESEKVTLIIPNYIFGWLLYNYWKLRYL